MDKSLLLPASILIGAAMIATGLYLGLGARGAGYPAPPPAPTAAPESAAQVAAAPQIAPQAPGPDLTVARETAKKDAASALEAQRASFKTKCWDPAFAKEGSPASTKVVFQMSFSAEGQEIGRGISELRGESRADVARCLRDLPMGLTIDPPGMPLSVDITFTLP